MHECMFCKKTYKRIANFSKHIVVCEKIHTKDFKNVNKIHEEPMTIHELSTIVRYLVKENNNLRKKVSCLEANMKRKRKKLYICNWLNEKYKDEKNTTEYINDFIITQEHLNYILDTNYVIGYSKILTYIYTNSDISMKAFNEKSNKIYIKVNNSWVLALPDAFSNIIFEVQKKILKCFDTWTNENEEKIEEDPKFYFDNSTKILGDPNKMETKKKRIYSLIYEKICQPLICEDMTVITF